MASGTILLYSKVLLSGTTLLIPLFSNAYCDISPILKYSTFLAHSRTPPPFSVAALSVLAFAEYRHWFLSTGCVQSALNDWRHCC